jgi:hypothetical protein
MSPLRSSRLNNVSRIRYPTSRRRGAYSYRSHIRAIARGCGGRYDEEHHVLGRAIAEAMFYGRRDVNTMSRTEGYSVALEFESCCAGEHVEELARSRMEMGRFAGTRRYTLLDDAKIRTFQKMPTVANGSPDVVLCARPINRHRFSWHFPDPTQHVIPAAHRFHRLAGDNYYFVDDNLASAWVAAVCHSSIICE